MRQRLWKSTALLLFLTSASLAEADERLYLPSFTNNTYIGLQLGYSGFDFSNKNLNPGYMAEKINNSGMNFHVYGGHEFSRYFVIEGAGYWTYPRASYSNINRRVNKNDINIAAMGLFLKPLLPLFNGFKLNALVGGGIVSRRGFMVHSSRPMFSQVVPSFMLGGGLTYDFTPHWGMDISGLYVFANQSYRQPSFYMADLGVHYLFLKHRGEGEPAIASYYFPYNQIEFGFYSNKITDIYVHKYFTPPYIPIFWKALVRARQGYIFSYQRNFFHTQKYFSMDWGVSAGHWNSLKLNNSIATAAAYLAFKLWFIRSRYADLYFTYSAAGPAYISRRYVDNKDLGGEFTFQDFLGFGALLGSGKHVNVSVKLLHFSNGYVLPEDPGFDVPLIFSVGFTW